MKRTSLSQIAGETGVSVSYLSQVLHGKKKPSEKVAGRLSLWLIEVKKTATTSNIVAKSSGAPNGIRIRVDGLKGRCPGPLDDGGAGHNITSISKIHLSDNLA